MNNNLIKVYVRTTNSNLYNDVNYFYQDMNGITFRGQLNDARHHYKKLYNDVVENCSLLFINNLRKFMHR
jgi:hypothetical protein